MLLRKRKRMIEGKWRFGYTNDNNRKWEIEPQFEEAGDFNRGLAIVRFEGKCGYINEKGDWVIAPMFDYAKDFHQGLAIAGIDGKFGFIDKQGEWKISPKFDGLQDFEYGLAGAEKERKWGFINEHGEWIVPPQYDGIFHIFEDTCTVYNDIIGSKDWDSEYITISHTGEVIKREFSSGFQIY